MRAIAVCSADLRAAIVRTSFGPADTCTARS